MTYPVCAGRVKRKETKTTNSHRKEERKKKESFEKLLGKRGK